MSSVGEEHVLVIPTAVFHEIGHFQGFCGDPQPYLDRILLSENVSYRPRSAMESDPSFKQLIPYVILQHADNEGDVWVFQYTRGGGQGESRLHRKRSVGIGGHISSEDADSGDAYEIGMQRELDEEVLITSGYQASCVGLINDDETEVGRVHLGVVHRFDLAAPQVEPREDDLLEAGFRPVGELLDELDGFETWSSICLRELYT